MTINKCYESVAAVKKEKLKMVHLEKEFGKHRTDQSNIFKHYCLFTYLTSVDAVDQKHEYEFH